MAIHKVEVFVLVDEDGQYVVSSDYADLDGMYCDQIGADASICRRVVKVLLSVPVEPFVTLVGSVPAEGEASLSVQ